MFRFVCIFSVFFGEHNTAVAATAAAAARVHRASRGSYATAGGGAGGRRWSESSNHSSMTYSRRISAVGTIFESPHISVGTQASVHINFVNVCMCWVCHVASGWTGWSIYSIPKTSRQLNHQNRGQDKTPRTRERYTFAAR